MSEKQLGNTNGRKWTEDQDAFLRASVVSNDLSYASIACRLNAQFGTNYSRNAAIGRAGRMGLINPLRAKKFKPSGGKAKNRSRPRVENKARPRIIASNGNSNSFRMIQSVENVAELKLRCVEIVPRNLSLMELEPNDCRYPYGGEHEPIVFCGHPKMEGSSYCVPHAALCRKPLHGNIGRDRPDFSAVIRKQAFGASVIARFDGERA